MSSSDRKFSLREFRLSGWGQKKEAGENRRLLLLSQEMSRYSDRLDILRPRSLRSASLGVGHSLSFLEIVVTHSFEVRIVEENVFAGSSINETETSVRQPFDRAFCHRLSDPKKSVSAESPETTGSGCPTADSFFTLRGKKIQGGDTSRPKSEICGQSGSIAGRPQRRGGWNWSTSRIVAENVADWPARSRQSGFVGGACQSVKWGVDSPAFSSGHGG